MVHWERKGEVATLKKIYFIFNWRIIALQYCIGFCHTTTQISHKCTYVSSLLNLPSALYPILPLCLLLSHFKLCLTLWTVAHQSPLSKGFSRQEYWSGLPFPSPGESSQPRNWTQVSCIAGRFFTNWAIRKPQFLEVTFKSLKAPWVIEISFLWWTLWVYGLLKWLTGKESTCQSRWLRRRGFDSPGWEFPSEKEIATHSSILAWEIPWTEDPGRL